MVVVLLAAVAAGCTDGARTAAPASQSGSPSIASASPEASGAEPSSTASGTDEERDGIVKAGPTVRLRETDEFGLVVEAQQRNEGVHVTVDRVDSLTGAEGERAATERGMDYSNDHFEVNDNPLTREYVLHPAVEIWLANPSDVASPKPLTVAEWLSYVNQERDYPPMFHFDVENGLVVAIEEQYFP